MNILFQVFLEFRILFVRLSLFDFIFDVVWDETGHFEPFLFLLGLLLLSLDNGCTLILRDISLHLFNLFLGESFFLFDALVFPFDLIFFARECLSPCVLDEGENFVLVFWLFAAEVEEGVPEVGGQPQH